MLSAARRSAGRAAIAVAVAFAVVVGVSPGVERATAQDSASVDIVNFAFVPSTVTITAGGTVTWTNSDSVDHTATGDGGSFDTGTIAPGGSASITFDTPGTYSYICSIHPEMTGTVVVEAAADGGAEDGAGDGATGDEVTGLPDTGAGTFASGPVPVSLGVMAGLAIAFALAALAIRRRTV